jgi:hypothetical protein
MKSLKPLYKEAIEMACIYCKGHMEKKTAPFNIKKNGYYLPWDAIPAIVCDRYELSDRTDNIGIIGDRYCLQFFVEAGG